MKLQAKTKHTFTGGAGGGREGGWGKGVGSGREEGGSRHTEYICPPTHLAENGFTEAMSGKAQRTENCHP